MKRRLIEEDVISTDDQYYVDVVNNNGIRVKEFLEAFSNLPPNGYSNPLLNVGPGGRILGLVNDIYQDEYEGHKFVTMTLSPYQARRYDFSISHKPALKVKDAVKIMSSMPLNYYVLIKSKNFQGTGVHLQDIILTHIIKIQMSESDGFFIRPDTFHHMIEDGSKKAMDFVKAMKHRMN